MKRYHMWALLGTSSIGLICFENLMIQGLMQGMMLLAINLRYNLQLIQGRIFIISMILELLLISLTVILYQYSIPLVIIL